MTGAILGYSLAAVAALMLVAWLISAVRRDVGVVDIFWAIAVTGSGFAAAFAAPAMAPQGRLALALASLWMLRLSAHILWRNSGKPEDRRYREIRARNEPGFWWKSLYLVFAFQALLALLVSLPLAGSVTGRGPGGALAALGFAMWLAGFLFETVADWQLARFQADAANAGKVMDRGCWRYSRHPNYFGEFLLWWGLYVIALDAGAWWSAIGPALLTFFLLKVSGVALTEKDMASRRPEYRRYIERTSAFFPRPPRG